MIKNPKFLYIFSELGEDWILREDIMRSLEEFVCLPYGSRRVKKADDLRHQLFQNTYQQKNKIIDLCPPCQQTLGLHSLRCNFVAKIWKNADVCTLQEPQLLIMVGLGNVKFSGLKRLFQTILSNCCQRAVMTRILKKQIQKALTIVTLSLEERTLKYNREVVWIFSARALIFLRNLCFKCSLFNDLIPILPGGRGAKYTLSCLFFAILKCLKPSRQNFASFKTHHWDTLPMSYQLFTFWDVTIATKLQKILQDICL